MTWLRDARRRNTGLVAPPGSVSALKIAAVLAAGVAIAFILASFTAGIGGIVYASRLRSVSPPP